MAAQGYKLTAVNILDNKFLDDEQKRVLIRYVLETQFEQAKKDLERENISLYVFDKPNDEKSYIAKPYDFYPNWEVKMYGTLHGFTFNCKTVKKPYPEAYYKVYGSSNEIKCYRAENSDEVWVVGKDKEVDKICHEIEQKIGQADKRSMDSKNDLSSSWEDLGLTYIALSQEEQALIYLHRMLDLKFFNDDCIVKAEPNYAVSIQHHTVNSSQKMKIESEIKQTIKKRSSEPYSSSVAFSPQEFTFLCRKAVYEYVDKKVNPNPAYIKYAWYIDEINSSVKIYARSSYDLKYGCDLLKGAFIAGTMSVPVKYICSPKARQKISELISKYSGKLDMRLDATDSTLEYIYTDDKKHDFPRDVTNILFATKTVNIFENWKFQFCKHVFKGIQQTTEERYNIDMTEAESKKGSYGWIIKGAPDDIKSASDELYIFVKNVCKKERIYRTDEDFKKMQENVKRLVIETKCCGSPEVVKNHVGKSIDLRRDVLCQEWQLLNSNTIKISNTGDHCWIPKQAVKWNMVLSDEKKFWVCNYQKTQSTVTLCLPAWKDNVAQEKHTLSTMLDTFYKSSTSERPKAGVPFILFLSEPMQHKWPWETFLKELLSALRRNCVLYPLYVFEPDRKTFETASELMQKFALQASRPPRIKITVKRGELAREECDAIVNSANEKLSLDTGAVSRSLLQGAGKELQDQCSEIMKHRGDITSKEVVVSDGYRLPCQFVFHGALELWEKQTLPEFAYNCLLEADARELSSIAFPSLGTGNLKYPPDIVAGIMFQTVQTYDTERKKRFLKDVNFVIFGKDRTALSAFQNAEQKLRSGCSKTEVRDKCPNSYFFKLTLTGENEANIEETFLQIQDNIKANSGYQDKNIQEPISPTISRSDKTDYEAGVTTEDKADYYDLKEWAASGESNSVTSQIEKPKIEREAKEHDDNACFINVTLFDGDNSNMYTNLVKTLDKYGVNEENVIWCPLKPNEARIYIRNGSDADSLIGKMKRENMYEFKRCIADAVVNIRAKLNTSVCLFMARNQQTAIDLKKQSGVGVLHEDDGAVILTGDLYSISVARDLLLKWKSEVSDEKQTTDKPDKSDHGKGDMPETDNKRDSGFKFPRNKDMEPEPNNVHDVQFYSRFGNSENQTNKDNLNGQKTKKNSRNDNEIEKSQNHKSECISNNKSSNTQPSTDYPPSSSMDDHLKKSVVPDNLQSHTKHEAFQTQVKTGGMLSQRGETIAHGATKLNESSPSVRPKEYNADKYSTAEHQLANQKGNDGRHKQNSIVDREKKEFQVAGHKIYPQLPQNIQNVMDEELLIEEPASQSPANMVDLAYFQVVNADSLMMTTKEEIKVYVYQGNLCYLNVHGIVNSSNESMNHTSGLFSVIAKEAGEKIIHECKQYLIRNKKLFQGQICVTSAGNLKHYKNILHACAPVWADRENTESYIEGLMSVIHNALVSADDSRLIKVAIPAIGSGGRGGPKQVCFSSFPRAVTQYSSKFGKTTSITEVHFVDRDLEVVRLMQTAFLLAIDESQNGQTSNMSKLKKIPQRIKETFLSYKGLEVVHSKYLTLVLPNKVEVVLCNSALFSVPRHKHGEKLKFEEKDTGVVITIDRLQTGKSRSASLCLQRCGNDFHRNYDSIKKLKKTYGEAYDTFGDMQLKFGHVICPVMPPLSVNATDKNSSAQLSFQSLFHMCCTNMLKKADDCHVKHLAVPVLVDDFYDCNEEWFLWSCTNIMMMELHTFASKRQRKSGLTVHIATNKNENLYQICKNSLSNPESTLGPVKVQPVEEVQYMSSV